MNNASHTYNDNITLSKYKYSDKIVNIDSNITQETLNTIIEREDCPCYKICFN